MRGRIVKFVPDRQFGFIAGADDQEYFFHRSSWMETEQPAKGDLVNFTPGSNSKGLRANNVQRLAEDLAQPESTDQFRWAANEGIFLTKSDRARDGWVIGQAETLSFEGSDMAIDDLREQLKTHAQTLGANGLLNYQYSKRTESNGNYRYTVHIVSANPAFIAHKVPSVNGDEEESMALMSEQAQVLINNVDAFLRRRSRDEIMSRAVKAVVVFALASLFLAWYTN